MPISSKLGKRFEVYKAIDSERNFQDDKWGVDKKHEVGSFILLMEEALQHARLGYYNAIDDQEALNNIRKVAALATVCMEQHGAPLREQMKPKMTDKEILQKEGVIPMDEKYIVVYTHSRSNLLVYIESFFERSEIDWTTSTTINQERAKLFTSQKEAGHCAKLLQLFEDKFPVGGHMKKIEFRVSPAATQLVTSDDILRFE